MSFNTRMAVNIVNQFIRDYNIEEKQEAYDELMSLLEEYYSIGYDVGSRDEYNQSQGKW